MAANRSSYINLYSVEDLSNDSYKMQIENKQAKVAVSGGASVEFDFPQYLFKKPDTSSFDLEARFDSLETDNTAANNSSAIATLQADFATEQIARQSGDVANGNLITAEVSNRVAGDQTLQAAIDSEAATARAAEQAVDGKVDQEVIDRAAAVSAEQARAEAAEAALGVRIDNVLSNADPAVLDSLSELLSAYQAADTSLGDSITAALARISTLESQMSELTSS